MQKFHPRFRVLLTMLFGLATLSPSSYPQPQTNSQSFPFMNPALPIDQRVNDLIGRMTLEEKVSQMRDHAPAIPRLGVPKYDWWNEGLHGVAFAGYATNFPQVIGMAATWDTSLVRRMGETTSIEARAKYNQAMREDHHEMFFGLTFWAPNINIFRDPRWGRGQETYGEDPYLTGRMGVAFVTGIQGDDPKYLKLVSTPKHYAVHSGPEPTRHEDNVDVSAHDLEDTYLPAFRATVTEAHAQSVMCAYNAIDGAPACANSMLLREHLRDAWHFDGYVVSDCAAVADVNTGHHYAPDMAHAAAAAVKAGTDLECGFGKGQAYPALVDAVQQNLITEPEIDTALRRLFNARFRLGMFDPPSSYAYGRIPISENNSQQHRQLSLQAARESMVLLKNRDNTLPLKSGISRIAVIGPTAELVQALQGNYNGPPPSPVYPLTGIEKRFARSQISYAQGSSLVQGLAMPIEHTALHPAGGSGNGLTGEYFNSKDFTGQPVLKRTDRNINFNWDKVVPVSGLQRDNYSVRWTGTFTPPAAGDYKLGVRVNYCYACENAEGFRLYLDDKVVVESGAKATGERGAVIEAPVHFTDAKPHPIRLEYLHGSGSAGIDLTWDPPPAVLRDEAVGVPRGAALAVRPGPDLRGLEPQPAALATVVLQVLVDRDRRRGRAGSTDPDLEEEPAAVTAHVARAREAEPRLGRAAPARRVVEGRSDGGAAPDGGEHRRTPRPARPLPHLRADRRGHPAHLGGLVGEQRRLEQLGQVVDAVLELHPRVEEALRCRDVGELSDDVLAAVGELAQKILFALGHSSAFRPIANSIHRERTRVTT